MTPPRHPGLPRRARYLPLSLAALLLAGLPLGAQVPQIPLVNLLAEAEQQLAARRPADAVGLLDEIIRRAQAGETLPPGVNLERLLLTAANTSFQLQQYPRAAELAQALERLPSVAAAALGEARMIHGLSLALEQRFAEAIPVFRAAEESTTFRDKALLYGAMAASQAGQIPVAIETYNRLLATAPRDRDWADAALALVDLHIRAGNLADARRGLALLRGRLELVDNLAGLNLLSLQLGDALMKAGDSAGALAAFRNVSDRATLVAEQERRNTALTRALERFQSLARPSATEADALRRLNARLEQAKTSLEQVKNLPAFDATLRFRLGFAFQERGGVWEAALLYEDLLARHPDAAERENAYFGLVRAYADAGRFERVRDAVERFTRAYPDSKFVPQALYLAALAAGQRNDLAGQLAFLGLAAERETQKDELSEAMRLMRANALFTLARHEEAKTVVDTYVADFPAGRFIEEARYLAAMADLAAGRATESEKQIRDYLRDFPTGRFVPDARYRLAAAAYARQDYAAALALTDAWLADFPPEEPQRGEIHSLRADALAGLDRLPEAIEAYQAALALPLSDEQLGYVLDELTRHHQTRREFDAAVAMWERFAAERPDHPYVINAAYWISRLRAREGRFDEALDLVSTIIRRYVDDPSRGDVERLLVEIASTLGRPPRTRRGEPKVEPIPEDQLFARVDQLLLVGDSADHPTARARALFTQSEIAAIRQNDPLRDQLLSRIATTFAPDQLPPGILGKVGDLLLQQGQADLAKNFYQQILTDHSKSIFADFGHVGLGEIALLRGDGAEALARFTAAIDLAGARFKLKEATLGRARAQLLLGRGEAARELLEQVAANRAWRGAATAEALYHLGEIARQRGTPDDLAKAQAHYQRVYLSYKRFPLWTARAYLRSAETFVKLGQDFEALTTINRFFTFRDQFEALPEWQQARALYEKLKDTPPPPGAPSPT